MYDTPADFLNWLPIELHMKREDISFEIATDQFLKYLEEARVRGVRLKIHGFCHYDTAHSQAG